MKKHSSNLFIFDKELTLKAYKKSSNCFAVEKMKVTCLNKIVEAIKSNQLEDIGIDYNKPWEDLDLDFRYYQIEYLFVGEILTPSRGYISDTEIGINIYKESRFGMVEFETEKILNLTFIIEKEPNK